MAAHPQELDSGMEPLGVDAQRADVPREMLGIRLVAQAAGGSHPSVCSDLLKETGIPETEFSRIRSRFSSTGLVHLAEPPMLAHR